MHDNGNEHMKKIGIIILVVLVLFSGAVLLFMFLPENDVAGYVTDVPDTEVVLHSPQTTEKSARTASMDDALFIGDSRSVGLAEHASLDSADFFAVVGMTVFRIFEAIVDIDGLGEVSLEQLLDSRKYGKIYIMLGVNEAGYPLENIITEYRHLLETVIEKQPDALIFIQANLRVTKEFSDGSDYIKNTAVDNINTSLSLFADGVNIFYIDANPVFDDGNGCLSPSHSSDGIHLYAGSYASWGEWIKQQTAMLLA